MEEGSYRKGHPESYHQNWLADDLVLRWMNRLEKDRFIRRAMSFGLEVVDAGTHLHIEPAPGSHWITPSGYRSPWWNEHIPV